MTFWFLFIQVRWVRISTHFFYQALSIFLVTSSIWLVLRKIENVMWNVDTYSLEDAEFEYRVTFLIQPLPPHMVNNEKKWKRNVECWFLPNRGHWARISAYFFHLTPLLQTCNHFIFTNFPTIISFENFYRENKLIWKIQSYVQTYINLSPAKNIHSTSSSTVLN